MPILYILCGPSGCGKSTWARNFITENDHNGNDIRYVSRDEIRYSLLKDGEDYFSHEKEVFKRFAGTIQQTLVDGFDVVADATHLNVFSRRKLTQAIDMSFTAYQIIFIVFETELNVCIKRNENREGRAYLPENIIRNMYREFKAPTMSEDERIIEIRKVSD